MQQIIPFFIGLLLSLGSKFILFTLSISAFLFLSYFFKSRYLTIILLCFFAGFSWGEINFYFRMHHVFPHDLEGKNIILDGRIIGVPTNTSESQEFQFSTEKGKMSLFWYKNRREHYPILKPGEKWRFTVRLKRPHGYRNPGSFDYEAWLFEQNIVAKGYIVNYTPAVLLEKSGWHSIIDQIRQRMGNQWQIFAHQWALLGVLLAFTVGLTGNITPEQWKVFANTGTIHLISISGFHINMMAGMAFGLVNFLWRRIPFLCERWPAQRMAALCAILMGGTYSLLAGYSIPTERSFITLTIFMGGLFLLKQTNVWSSLWWSVFIVILLDPFAPLNLSFWLTYSAVVVILYAIIDRPFLSSSQPEIERHAVLNRAKVSLCSSLNLQWKIFLGLIPFSLFWFSQVSISSLWANLIAIPMTGFLILPFALFAIFIATFNFSWAVFFMKIANFFIEKLYELLSWISDKHPVILSWSLSEIWMLLLAVLGILILLAPKGFPGRWLGFVLWLPLLFPLKNTPNYGEANFTLLDVGQGLASVIQTKNHVLIFDTGPKFSETFDAGQAVILPYLRHEYINTIDAVVVSHKDMDHRGGLESIVNHMPIKKVWVNDQQILKNAPLCQSNIKWTWDGITFQFLTEGLEQFRDTNNTSCVLKVSSNHHSILLPGDLEARAEKVLVKQYGDALKSDLLIAGHHGSKTSSSIQWLDAINPRYVLFATGYLNRYHFPNADIVLRYDNKHIKYLSTADCGMIQWRLTKNKHITAPHCYVRDYPRQWY